MTIPYFISFILALSFISTVPLSLADAINLSAGVGGSFEDFHYEEENRQDDIIDEEDGTLPGLFIDLQARSRQWFIAGGVHARKGEVDYVAYPASDNELNSRTDESMLDLNLILGFSQNVNENTQVEYMVGLGRRKWEREIQSLPDIPGLDETYKWPYLSLAIMPVFQLTPQGRIDLLLRAKRTFNATLDVEFKGGLYDQVKLDLDDGRGLELEATWLQKAGPATAIGFGPYLHFWWFDESDSFTLTRNGIPIGTVYEPASYTRSLGLRLFIRKYF